MLLTKVGLDIYGCVTTRAASELHTQSKRQVFCVELRAIAMKKTTAARHPPPVPPSTRTYRDRLK